VEYDDNSENVWRPDVPTRLLVVDDDAATLLGLTDALQRKLPDVAIQTASSAERALILMALEHFDVILSDVRMPGMDGMAFLKEIKTLCPETIVLLMSGCAPERRAEALRVGAREFLEKPFEIKELVAALRRAMQDAALAKSTSEAHPPSSSPLREAGPYGMI
jgi:DNA-binding NtrC family response regulator